MRPFLYFIFFLFFACSVSQPVSAQCKKNGPCKITEANGNVSQGKNRKGQKTGEWKTVTSSGLLLATTNYSEGKRNGTYTLYQTNGKVYYTGTYKNDLREGQWFQMTPRGDTTTISTYRNDTLHGYYCSSPSFSNKKIEGAYVHGVKEGYWVESSTLDNNDDRDSMYYHNDKLEGAYKKYHRGFLLSEINYKDGKREGREIRYHNKSRKVASITYFRSDLRDSVMLTYFENGMRARITWYSADQRVKYDSLWVMAGDTVALYQVDHFSGPEAKTFHEERTRRGVLVERRYQGTMGYVDSSLTFHVNGVIAERKQYTTKTGEKYLRERTYSQWFYTMSGKLEKYGEVRSSSRNGMWVWMDDRGKKTKEIEYDYGKVRGTYRSYYPNGKMKVSGVCRDNYLRDSVQVFSATGVLLKKGTAAYNEVLNKQMQEDQEVDYLDPDDPLIEEMNGIDEAAVEVMEVAPPHDEVFTFAEVMPKFPGDSMYAFIKRNLIYPSFEKEQGKEGTVYIQCTVERDGTLSNIHAVKEIPGAPGFTKEAIRLFSIMPRWEPGLMNGRTVKVNVTQPIKFSLQ